MSVRILIVEAPFYQEISDLLISGVIPVLEKAGVSFERLEVPGALEIPAAIKFAKDHYDAFIALGCVIRGETSHYETVCNESARGLMDLTIHHDLVVINGVLTCENMRQAIDRADPKHKNKGASFASGALKMIEVQQKYQ